MYGKKNADELNPLQGIPGQNMEKSIMSILAIFDKYKDIEEFKTNVIEHKKKLDAFKEARKYQFISDLVGGQKKVRGESGADSQLGTSACHIDGGD